MTKNETRIAIVQAILNDEGSALSEETLYERVDTSPRKVDSALQGLKKAGILQRHGLVGESFWAIDPSASKDDIKQALQSRSVTEAADEIMERSSMFGDTGSSGRSDDFEHLL